MGTASAQPSPDKVRLTTVGQALISKVAGLVQVQLHHAHEHGGQGGSLKWGHIGSYRGLVLPGMDAKEPVACKATRDTPCHHA